jgi:hypothetical protein
MSFIEPAASGYELTASEIDPAHHAIVPSDEQQDLAFRSIRAIDARSIQPFGPVSLTSERKTAKGVRPMIWVRLPEALACLCTLILTPFWLAGPLERDKERRSL